MKLLKKVFEYKRIEGVPEQYLDYMLVDSLPRKSLENILKDSSELTKKLKLTGFRINQLAEFKIKSSLAKYLAKDFILFTMIYNMWDVLYVEDLVILEGLTKDEFISKIPQVLKNTSVCNVINYIRTEREDLYDLVLPLIKEWHLYELEAKKTSDKLGFTCGGESFSELFSAEPFIFEKVDMVCDNDLDVDNFSDFDVFDEEVNDEANIQRKLLEKIIEMPVDKSLNTLICGLNVIKTKLGKSSQFECLETKEQLQTANSELKNVKNEITKLRSNLKSKEALVLSLNKKNSAAEKKVEALNQKISNSNTENGRLGAEVGNLRKETIEYKSKLVKVERELENLKLNQDKKEKKYVEEIERKHGKEINSLKAEYQEKIGELESKSFKSITTNENFDVTIIEAVPGLKKLYDEMRDDENAETQEDEGKNEEMKYEKGTISLNTMPTEDFSWFENLDEFSPE